MTCQWEFDAGCIGGDAAVEALDPALWDRALSLATSTLQMLTNYRVGLCPSTIRPCPEQIRCTCFSNLGLTGSTFSPHMEADGLWYNSCGCRQQCTPLSEVDIPGPVGYIDSLRIDGVEQVLDSGDWRLDDGHLLVWQGAGVSPIPSVQDLNKPDTEPGTWSLTYSRSYPVDGSAKVAVSLLAMEYVQACKPKGKCSLPRGVTNVVRNGVTFTVNAGLFINGLTGIEVVDAFITKWAPAGSPARTAVVFDPRKHAPRRSSSVPMRTQGVFVKDPDAVKDYEVDWTRELGTDTIASSTWLESTGTIVMVSDSHTAAVTKLWLSGGIVNTTYRLTNRITTVGGRTDDRTITVRVREH